MNIINTKDVPTRLASPYSAKYRHRRPYPYPRTKAPIGAHSIKVLTHLKWKTVGQRCPNLGNSCSYSVSKFRTRTFGPVPRNDKYLAYVAWLTQSTYSHSTAYTVYAIPAI